MGALSLAINIFFHCDFKMNTPISVAISISGNLQSLSFLLHKMGAMLSAGPPCGLATCDPSFRCQRSLTSHPFHKHLLCASLPQARVDTKSLPSRVYTLVSGDSDRT